ncbi:MAG: cytochrome c3 family protein [Planctomycetota bacterium]|jgi:hypothetical protein
MPDEGGLAPLAALIVLAVLVGVTIAAQRPGGSRLAQVLVVLSLVTGYWVLGGQRYHCLPGNHQGYEPVQPIVFSHKVHAGDLGMECLGCHHAAEKGPVANIPSVQSCMDCHEVVRNAVDKKGTSLELEKLYAIWETRNTDDPRSVAWVRVHNLPDFITVNHRSHLLGGMECEQCHGPVEEMERMRQASDLSMGWCVECHRREANECQECHGPAQEEKRLKGAADACRDGCVDCHKYEGAELREHRTLSEAPLDCSACHR